MRKQAKNERVFSEYLREGVLSVENGKNTRLKDANLREITGFMSKKTRKHFEAN